MVNDSILQRIRKIKALTDSTNVHEAAVAVAKLSELLLRHNLSLVDIDAGDEGQRRSFEKVSFETGQVSWKRDLIYYIAVNNFCRSIYWRRTPRVTLLGERHNVEAVIHLYQLVEAQIVRLAAAGWKEVKDEHWHTTARSWKNAFCQGAAAEINDRLEEMRRDVTVADPNANALVVITDRELDDAYKLAFPGSSTSRRKGVDADAYYSGKLAARNIQLDKSLTPGVRALTAG